jgi:short-subunit dehydrogenase
MPIQQYGHVPIHQESSMTATDKTPGTALITGASSGIGAIYADRLARRGYDLILVARNAERLATLAQRLTAETGRTVTPLVADLTDKDDLRKVEEVLRTDSRITVLVNNAGFGSAAPLLQADVEAMQSMIDVNVTAPTRLTYAAVPGFVARGGGSVINISSIVAVAPELLNGVYGGSKAFVLAFSQQLRHELGAKGIRVQAVLPGPTSTEFWDIAGAPIAVLPQAIQQRMMRAEDLVDAALAGFDQGEVVTIPALPEIKDWDAVETARQALGPNLANATPAARYGL